MSTYTKTEIDNLVAGLSSRITTASGTLSEVNAAITAHDSNAQAHKALFDDKATNDDVTLQSNRIDGLNETIQDLTERLGNLESMSGNIGLKGTLSYLLTGTATETSVNVTFDIEPIDENHPVTYEVYGDGTLISGLTFDAAAGTITGTPTSGGTATYIILAKSGSHGVFITVNQNFEGVVVVPPDNTATKGFAELSEIVTKLRAGNTSDLVMGTQYTITMADDTVDTSRTLTYNDLVYKRYPAEDTDTLYAWANADSRIYTDEIAIIANAAIKDVSGNIIGTLATTPSYMKDYKIMITSIDTDEPTAGTYAHNARFEFLNTVGTRVYDEGNSNKYQTSDIRSYLTSEDADGFMVRLPADIRGLIVPNNIECVTNYNSGTTETLSDKVFLPSAWEMCGTINSGYWYQEGTKSTYYPTSYNSEDKRERYNLSGTAQVWWTRTPLRSDSNYVIDVGSDGHVDYHVIAINSRGVAPAFVIA